MEVNYTITTTVDGSFDDVVSEVTQALQDEGFGVLSDIDVKETLKEKLDVDVDQYRILGACNPSLAHEGLEEEPALGVLLPCNVIVYETDDGRVDVSAVNPEVLVGISENPSLERISEEVGERFKNVIETVDERFA